MIGDPLSGISGSVGSRLSRYFNTAAFAQPAQFSFGNSSPLLAKLRRPGINNWDANISKELRVTERVKATLRASMFNLLNHPTFGIPQTGLDAIQLPARQQRPSIVSAEHRPDSDELVGERRKPA